MKQILCVKPLRWLACIALVTAPILSLQAQEKTPPQEEKTTLKEKHTSLMDHRKSLTEESTLSDKIDISKMNNPDQLTNAIDAIRGRVAGMQIERNGSNALNAVRLRGTTSLAGGNDPLIIVNGVMGDLTLLQSIYPTDIESFSILKDAAETAQYGTRGASGVILINTFKGTKDRVRVQYNGLFGFSSVYKTPEMLSGDEYRNYAAQRGISILDQGASTDFSREIIRTGFNQQHHVAFSGSTGEGGYRVSLSYGDRQSVIRERGERTFMSNMNVTQRMFDGLLDIDLGMFGSNHKQEGIADEQKLFYSAAAINPTFPADKTYGYASASQINNPLALLDMKNDAEQMHFNAHARLLFHILPGLNLTLFGSYSYDSDEGKQYFPNTVWNRGQAYRSTLKQEALLGHAILNYAKDWQRHRLEAMLMGEAQRNRFSGFHTTVTNFSSDENGYNNLSAGALRPWTGTGSTFEEPTMSSYLGRVGYQYANRYLLAASLRADGSSKLGTNHKWGYFPSVSASWVVSEEAFMHRQTIIDKLKINVGYGISGNLAGIDSYTTIAYYKAPDLVSVGGSNLVSYSRLRNSNPDLKWEVSRTLSAGIEAELFKGRLLCSLDYYNTRISDMLYPYIVSVPPFKNNILVANLGSMRNSGVELSIGGTPLVNKDMTLTINANVSFQRNKLRSLGGDYNGIELIAPAIQGYAGLNGAGFHSENNVTYRIVGETLGSFYLPHCTGLVPNDQGGMMYAIEDIDRNGEMDDGYDRYIAGQAMPKVFLGANISFRWKAFDIAMQMNGAFGHKIYNGTSLTYMNTTSFPLYNIMKEAPEANIQDQTVTDYWLENGDYLNIDYISLGWQVPLRKNRFIEQMRLSLTMNNVATITGYSGLTPMINSSNVSSTLGVDDKRSYPLYHTYTLGISMNF